MTKSDESLLIHGFGSWLCLFPIGFHPARNTTCWLLRALQECARSCFQGFIQNPAGSAVPGVLPTLLLNTSALETAKGYVPSGLCARVPQFGLFRFRDTWGVIRLVHPHRPFVLPQRRRPSCSGMDSWTKEGAASRVDCLCLGTGRFLRSV